MGAGLLHFAGLAQVARDTALEASVPFRFDPRTAPSKGYKQSPIAV